MNDGSSLRRFVRASRDFGFVIAMSVAYSKVRGRLWPALALPDGAVQNARPRDVSILFSTAGQDVAALDGVVEVLAGLDGLNCEVCICERSPVEPEMARALARWRGTQPWIHIVRADGSVDDATAARWTLEQATGEFVALVAPGYTLKATAIARLLAKLHSDSGIDAAILVGTNSGSPLLPSRDPWADCCLLLQRKCKYLAAPPGCWQFAAPALARDLDERGVPIAYLTASEVEAVD